TADSADTTIDETVDEDVTDHCQSTPCLNGGICVNKVDGYTCDCTHIRYVGDNCDEPGAFVTVWKTDNVGESTDNQIQIYTAAPHPDFIYNYNIDCDNDGVFEAENQTKDYLCEYDSPGRYTIVITGLFPYFMSRHYALHAYPQSEQDESDANKLLSVEQWGSTQWSSMGHSFEHCSNMVINALDTPDLSHVTDMSAMFAYATSFNQPIGSWDVSHVENMHAMFGGAAVFNQDISSWDVSHVTNMCSMFVFTKTFNQPLGSWNVSHVENMYAMFGGAAVFNQDISSWNVANVSNMFAMFSGAQLFNKNIDSWDVSHVSDMAEMFSGATSFNQPLGSWNVRNVKKFTHMFHDATSFNQDISQWRVFNVFDMSYMFANATAFNQNIGSWDVSHVSNMDFMFSGVTLSTENYDALLEGWSKLILHHSAHFDAGDSQYCATLARQKIVDDFAWHITDGGIDSSCEK
ncbi:BspA family leucine-rich repeat surface protein, partial [bacterium]|nr:BspA family leucine-rich repeat surface protein [bacterium]